MNVLGKVAKGVGGVVFGTPEAGGEDAEVEKLLQRVADGVLPEDRREALALLRDLLSDNAQAQLALGASGFPVLCGVLRDERNDVEMVRSALECLLVATSPQLGHSNKEGPRPGAINAELFMRGKDNVALLLSLLEDEPVGVSDFYVRYHTVQLLTAMSITGSYRIQEAILASPMGVVRLMDMMAEREVIRNEALLLLIGLTRANADIQKIAAFEGAFDRLLNIIREEGGADGGIIVQDSLELLNNLLRGNAPNQLMFREMGFLANIAALLQAPTNGQVSRQKAGNLLCALETVYLLVSPPTPAELAADARAGTPNASEQNTAANRAALLQGGVLEALLGLALSSAGGTPPALRTQALRAVAQLVSNAPQHQERLMSAKVPPTKGGGPPISALHAVLRTALFSSSAEERAAAQQVLRSFCSGNAEGQSMLVCTIMPVGDDMDQGGPSTFGGELVGALIGSPGQKDLQASCRAAGVLAHLLAGNAQAKERVLTIPLAIPASASAPPELLMPTCIKYLTSALASSGPHAHGEQLGAVVLLRMLVTWLHDCPPAVAAFLATASHLPFLVDVITGRLGGGDANVIGLAALLLGACLVFNPQQAQAGPQPGCSAATVLDVITARIGLSEFFGCLDALQRSELFVGASAGPRQQKPITREAAAAAIGADEDGGSDSDSDDDRRRPQHAQHAHPGPNDSPFDYEFTQFVNASVADLRQRVMAMYSRPADGASSRSQRLLSGSTAEERLQSAQLVIVSLEREVDELRARAASGGQASTTAGAAATYSSSGSAEAAELQMRASRAEVEAAALREQLDTMRGDCATLEQRARSAQAEADEAHAAAQKHETDLEDLSGAYNNLEAHSFQLEAQVRELQQQLRSAGSPAATGAAAPSEDEIDARVAAAVEAAQAEADESMNDLLECLGQEEAKVERLRQRLEELGEDVDGLLEGVGKQEAADEEADS
ncbi:hypothetical protein WJX72_010794 [[Myrmecia] bisecta]|uniref:General vesicular transport factor p115 n=1 Tax=[Myrmecia] bisecta TaxID=41462 RepID=A0AAW1Q1T4_9CHLO